MATRTYQLERIDAQYKYCDALKNQVKEFKSPAMALVLKDLEAIGTKIRKIKENATSMHLNVLNEQLWPITSELLQCEKKIQEINKERQREIHSGDWIPFMTVAVAVIAFVGMFLFYEKS